MLALTFNPSAQVWSEADYNALWVKVNNAISEGKPQTAVAYLGELERMCAARKDTLEQYKVMKTKYECLSKYNWKEANKYYPEFNSFRRQITDNLDYYLETYANHPAVDWLVYEKILRLKRNVDASGTRSGARYREIRKICMKAAEVLPKGEYRNNILDIVRQMDSKDVSLVCRKSFIYPGDKLDFELSARNVGQSSFDVCRLNDRFNIVGGEPLKKLSGHGRKLTSWTVSSYKNEYNMSEKVPVSYTFTEPGIYLVANTAEGQGDYVVVYVSRVGVAARSVDGHNEVYVADPRTGKPADKATIFAWTDYSDGKAEPANETFVRPDYLSQKDYALNGFTPLTQEIFTKKITFAQLMAQVAGDRWAPAISISEAGDGKRSRSSDVMHYIYTDRTLYRASDTIRFKLIAVSTNYEQGKVLAGKRITVSLRDPASAKPVSKVTVTTNQMGSAAGSFVIPEGSRNGSWRLETDRGAASFHVEAYKDPKFKIEFEKIKEIYTFEDNIAQIGRVMGLTGSGVANARVEYTVEPCRVWNAGKTMEPVEGSARTDADGFFEVPFVAPLPEDANIKSMCYRINVKAVAPGGETCEAGKIVTVSRSALSFAVSLDNEYRMDTLLLVNKEVASSFTISATNSDGVAQDIPGWYRLEKEGELRSDGTFSMGEPVALDFGGYSSGEYVLRYGANLAGGTLSGTTSLVLLAPDDRGCPVDRKMFFYPVKEKDAVDFVVGTSEDDLYIQLELFDAGKVVYRKPLHLVHGMQHIKLDYKAAWQDEVTVSLFGFRDMEEVSLRHNFSREVPSFNFDIKVSSLRDRTTPNTKETFTVETKPSEMLISIYDITCDRYSKNSFYFNPIHPYSSYAPYAWSNVSGSRPYYHVAYGNRRLMSKAVGVELPQMMMNDMVMAEESAVLDTEVSGVNAADDALPESGQIDIREDFTQTLAFIPQMEIPASGNATVTFTTRESLSTFRIAMLAHTKDLRSGTAESQIIVDKAVRIESYAPLFAVEGDRLIVKANVTNTSRETVKGRASLRLSNEDAGIELDIPTVDRDVTLKPGASQTVSWEVKMPSAVRRMGITTLFASKNISDAEKHLIEIVPASRTITEAESFVIGSGRNKNSCIRDLKARFPYPNAEIRYEEYTTKDALREVLKQPAYPKGDNMIEWLDALYLNQMRGALLGVDSVDTRLSRRAVNKLATLQKPDGGFGWFPCNNSSDLLTMMFLDKAYYMRELGALPRNTNINKLIDKALGYVEKRILEKTSVKKWDWRDLTYLFASRLEYPNIAVGDDIRKVLQEYVRKCRDGWQDLPIVEKARLCTVLDATDTRQMLTVMRSLRDYAVRNDNVGCYFPNAAMPYRGMLHTELYAHALLAAVFGEMEQMDIAKGIMKWLLLQKHNQEWGSNMASADAIYALLKYRAPDVRFGAVYYTYYAPMTEVQASSNQLSVSRSWWRDGKKLKDGEKLRVGDKIEVRYDIYNTENRSFVVMEASRPACFYPADERSSGTSWFYCERLADRTKYYFQTLAEEDTALRETFYVTQEGTFNSALVTIESLYAPEYRGHTGAFKVETKE